MPQFQVTKHHLNGLLRNARTTEITRVEFTVGKVYQAYMTRSQYRVEKVEQVEPNFMINRFLKVV